jgi:hypothetical protein
MEWEPPDRSGPRHVRRRRCHAPRSGCRSKVGGLEPGVFASLDPRLMSVTPIGVGVFQLPRRDLTTSRLHGSLDRRVRCIRPLGPHPRQTAPPRRARHPSTTRPEGAEEMSRGSSEATPPVTRPTPTAAPREGCQNAGSVESMGADDHPSQSGSRSAMGIPRPGPALVGQGSGDHPSIAGGSPVANSPRASNGARRATAVSGQANALLQNGGNTDTPSLQSDLTGHPESRTMAGVVE